MHKVFRYSIATGFFLLFFVSFFTINAAAQVYNNQLDNFEDDIVGNGPLGDFYVEDDGDTDVVVSSNFALSGTNSLQIIQDSTNTDVSGLLLNTDYNMCKGGKFVFYSYFTAFPTTGYMTMGLYQNDGFGGNAEKAVIGVGVAGDVFSSVRDGTNTAGGGWSNNNLPLNEWVYWSIETVRCKSISGSQGASFIFCRDDSLVNNECNTTTITSTTDSISSLRYFGTNKLLQTVNSFATFYVDDIEIIGQFRSLPNENSVALTNVVGFDLAPSGTHFIVRHNGGSTVSVYDAQSMTLLGPAATTNCNRQHGVLAFQNGVMYMQCDGGGVPISLQFKKTDMTAYNMLLGGVVPITGATNVANWLYFSPDTKSGPTRTISGPGIQDDFSFFVATLDGKVLEVAFTIADFGNEGGGVETQLSYSGSTVIPEDVCSDYRYEHYVVDTASTTLGYISEATFTNDGEEPVTDLDVIFTGGAAINSANDIDCGSQSVQHDADYDTVQRIIVGKGSTIQVVTPNNGLTEWNRGLTSLTDVAMSLDANWGAYIGLDIYGDQATGIVVNATNGNRLGVFTVPAGTIFDLAMDSAGQSVWIVTTAGVFRSTTYEATTITPVSTIPDDDETNTITTSTTGGGGFGGGGSECTSSFLGINIAYVANAWETSETAIRWLLGLLLLSLVLYGMARIGGAFLLVIAVIIGTGIGIVFCLFPVWLILVEIFVLVLAVGATVFGDKED